jgi:hypothetical protein
MPHEIRSITQVGTSEPFELQVSRGQITLHYKLHKFGFNSLVQNVEETIWDVGGIYTYPSSAVKMTATSTDSSNDDGVQVTVQGLDADYNELSETVTLDGSGTAETNQFFLRVNRAFIAGSQEPSGTINITNSSTTYARITLGDNQSLMALWTVPAGYTAYMLQNNTTCYTEANNKFGITRLVTKEPGGVFRTQDKHTVVLSQNVVEYPIPKAIPEKTDIEVRAIASSSNANLQVSASFDIVYIKNEVGV